MGFYFFLTLSSLTRCKMKLVYSGWPYFPEMPAQSGDADSGPRVQNIKFLCLVSRVESLRPWHSVQAAAQATKPAGERRVPLHKSYGTLPKLTLNAQDQVLFWLGAGSTALYIQRKAQNSGNKIQLKRLSVSVRICRPRFPPYTALTWTGLATSSQSGQTVLELRYKRGSSPKGKEPGGTGQCKRLVRGDTSPVTRCSAFGDKIMWEHTARQQNPKASIQRLFGCVRKYLVPPKKGTNTSLRLYHLNLTICSNYRVSASIRLSPCSRQAFPWACQGLFFYDTVCRHVRA